MTSLYDAILRPGGLRATQVTILMAVAATDQPTLTRLADLLVMDRTTLTRDLKPLEAQGLLLVRPGDDRRTRLITLTEAGWRKHAAILPLWAQAQAHMIAAGIGVERWARVSADLQDVVRVAQAAGP